MMLLQMWWSYFIGKQVTATYRWWTSLVYLLFHCFQGSTRSQIHHIEHPGGCVTRLVQQSWKDQVTAGVKMHLPRRLYHDPLTTAARMTELLGGGCVTTSPTSTDVMLSLASMHIQMPGVTLLDNNWLATSGFFRASRRWMLSWTGWYSTCPGLPWPVEYQLMGLSSSPCDWPVRVLISCYHKLVQSASHRLCSVSCAL